MGTFLEYVNAKDVEFCKQRKKGASKIAREAPGGVGRLTQWHFAAKLLEYDECLSAIKEGKHQGEFFKQKMMKYLREAGNATNQRNFQESTGKAEVWGEIYFEVR
jgi:hypothetical protein